MITKTLEETLEDEANAEAEDINEMSTIEREHYEEIVELNREVYYANDEYLVFKSEASSRKKRLEMLQSKLTSLIARGPQRPDPQQTLPFTDDENKADEINPDAWRDEPITDAIKITNKQFERLEEAGARTMGQLEDLRAGKFPTYPDGLRSIKGFGDKAIDTIEDQILEWWDKNKNAREPEVAEESEEDAE